MISSNPSSITIEGVQRSVEAVELGSPVVTDSSMVRTPVVSITGDGALLRRRVTISMVGVNLVIVVGIVSSVDDGGLMLVRETGTREVVVLSGRMELEHSGSHTISLQVVSLHLTTVAVKAKEIQDFKVGITSV